MRPTGTVTFLFTDIEGSTQCLADVGVERYGALLEVHRALLRDACGCHAGHDFGGAGDSMFVAFGSAQDALRAAFAAQCMLADHGWPGEQPFRVRMGVHTCDATSVADDYVGLGVHRASRICDAGHGGQILLSHATHALVMEGAEFEVRDLGEHVLKGLPQPQRLYQLLHPRLQAEFPALRTAGKPSPNLPVQTTPIVGRDRELHAIESMLCEPGTHLLTLTGPGGTGKTRLAIHAAADLADEFAHGIYFVSLAAIDDPALVLPAIANTLGVSAAAGQSLPAYMAGKSMLVVMDNFEQVVAAAPALGSLMIQAPSVRFLATSREPLHLSGERVFPVSPLAMPDTRHLPALEALMQCESVALFVERARAVQPDFSLTADSAQAIAEICLHLDGLPLAIELAAARTALLSPNAMLKRLPERLKLLTGGARDVPARQQTIRNAVAWSYDLLNASERDTFARLGVFPGTFSIEAAETIGTAGFDEIASLVDKSLVKRRADRLGMLETIRSFANETLDASTFGDATHDRHAAFFETLVHEASRRRAANEKESLDALELEHDNVRAALEWLRGRATGRFVSLAGALGWFWHLHSHFTEGRAYLAEAIALALARDEARAQALSAAGELAAWAGDPGSARTAIEEAVAIWGELGRDREIGAARLDLGWGCFYSGESAAARACMEESLRIAQAVKDPALIARAHRPVAGAGCARRARHRRADGARSARRCRAAGRPALRAFRASFPRRHSADPRRCGDRRPALSTRARTRGGAGRPLGGGVRNTGCGDGRRRHVAACPRAHPGWRRRRRIRPPRRRPVRRSFLERLARSLLRSCTYRARRGRRRSSVAGRPAKGVRQRDQRGPRRLVRARRAIRTATAAGPSNRPP